MLCTKCDGRGFQWKIEQGTRQTLYGQDLAYTGLKQGERCNECGGAGTVETRLTLTAFGWLMLIVAVATVIALGQFWPEL